MKSTSFLLFPIAALLLFGCSAERLLSSKAQVYLKGTPPVQIMRMQHIPGAAPVDMDPMKYTVVLMQYVEEALKLEGLNVSSISMNESFAPTKSSQFMLEVSMAMVEERPSLNPNPSAEGPGMMNLSSNLASMLTVVAKEGRNDIIDYHLEQEMSPAEQAKVMEGDPEADINKLLLEQTASKLAKQVKEDVVAHLKAHKKGL